MSPNEKAEKFDRVRSELLKHGQDYSAWSLEEFERIMGPIENFTLTVYLPSRRAS